MNCKPGDLAIYVNRLYAGMIFFIEGEDTPGLWFVSPKIRDLRSVADKNLRPIRDNGGEDETLSWVGKPEKVSA